MTETKTITSAEYAKLIKRSERTARRWLARSVVRGATNVAKVNGRWQITLTKSELRYLRRKFVDLEHYASSAIRALKFDADISKEVAQKEYAREALVIIGAGDLVHAIDHAKLWRGRTDKYGYNVYRSAMADIERLVAK